jgi:dimethylargininase
MSHFTKAIVRPPAQNFADGLTSVDLGKADYERALQQHRAYCDALKSLGLSLTELEPDDQYPDSTFVEDTAVITARGVILARPGAPTRAGEVSSIETVLSRFFSESRRIVEPGTLDGGDVCEAGDHFFIGVSRRTNESGARQLAEFLAEFDYSSSLIDIRETSNILHLKSGLAFLGNGYLVSIDELSRRKEFREYEIIRTPPGEEYLANCLFVNDRVLVADGYAKFPQRLSDLGFKTMALEMSEFQKMDGGLSCLSLRF